MRHKIKEGVIPPPPQPRSFSYQKLCIFTQHRTYTFENVTVLKDNEYALVFEYRAVSDGLFKTHTALKENIVGYSTTR